MLSTGRHTFGSAVTRRQTANRPAGTFTPTLAARPGEQVQIDSTPIDVMVVVDSGQTIRADLPIVVDVATRTFCAAALRPVGTKAVDAALLLAKMLVPEPMARLVPLAADGRLAAAACPPAGRGCSDGTGRRPASDRPGHDRHRRREGISIGHHRRGHVQSDQHLCSVSTSPATWGRTSPAAARTLRLMPWTVPELQNLFDEWLIAGWQARPHDSLRNPYRPKRAMSPNEKYTSLVQACGYLPLTLSGEDYLELLPVSWRQINDSRILSRAN
ncbi:hypothetical protein ACIQI7_36255 [Kitasatospora sp. NPDC092039]|uniref:hypothetical protein n=1 Tax=Kitasatospora sp. NPDC092039 TaxID=3364086 RepID=UPI00382B7AB6